MHSTLVCFQINRLSLMAFFLHLPRKYTKLYFIVCILQPVLGVKVVFVQKAGLCVVLFLVPSVPSNSSFKTSRIAEVSTQY